MLSSGLRVCTATVCLPASLQGDAYACIAWRLLACSGLKFLHSLQLHLGQASCCHPHGCNSPASLPLQLQKCAEQLAQSGQTGAKLPTVQQLVAKEAGLQTSVATLFSQRVQMMGQGATFEVRLAGLADLRPCDVPV